ncbi:putative C6 and C2H2 transcription factor [Phyllosticta capitalensis]|uniref:C6 and C2H2 transcription factor n=1 Tax=Phyllosticta capitalensis TaxID=121624 RepID=A0ABR1YUZ5_9PEZI
MTESLANSSISIGLRPIPRTTQAGGRFPCAFPSCKASYARREHLNRHAKQHLSKQLFACPLCDNRYPRKSHHGGDVVGRARALRACSQCRARKTPCRASRQAPCGGCRERGVACSFLPAEQQRRAERTDVEALVQNAPDSSPRRQPVASDSDLSDTQVWIDAYFTHFHPKWPILHKATFRPKQEPPFLVQSVLMIGLWASGGQSARSLACEIHDRLRVSIHDQRSKWDLSVSTATAPSSSSHWPIGTYQGILLNTIFALLKDDCFSRRLDLRRQLPDIEYQTLRALVQSCRAQRMFHYPTVLAHYSDTGSAIYAWTFTEEMKRLGLALYKVSGLCCPGNEGVDDGPLLTLADLQFSMPDSEYLWSAASNAELAQRTREEGKSDRNTEGHWISNVAPILQAGAANFDWV